MTFWLVLAEKKNHHIISSSLANCLSTGVIVEDLDDWNTSIQLAFWNNIVCGRFKFLFRVKSFLMDKMVDIINFHLTICLLNHLLVETDFMFRFTSFCDETLIFDVKYKVLVSKCWLDFSNRLEVYIRTRNYWTIPVTW